MRGAATATAILIFLTGCVGGASDPFPETIATSTPQPSNANLSAPLPSEVRAPTLRVGQAWTYEGAEFYNPDRSFTVVVASATPRGYLFAGGAEDDLVYEALWQSPWYGQRDTELQRGGHWVLLDFPLFDGARWEYGDGISLVARTGEVETPQGRETGFLIDGENDRMRIHLEYAPSIGNIVRLHREVNGAVRDDLRMTRADSNVSWIWYELGDLHVVPNPHEPSAFQLEAGFDAVLASAGGTAGARALLHGPEGAAWSTEFANAEEWRHAIMPASPGAWGAAVAGHPYIEGAPDIPGDAPTGWAYMHVAPVKWLRSG